MHIIVLNGGGRVHPALASLLRPADLVIAADSGADHAAALGLQVDQLIGDLDSVDQTVLDELRRAGTFVETHPTDKAATDLDLALDAAIRTGAQTITVVGGAGDRFDHLLGAVAHLSSPRYDSIGLDAWFASAHIVVVRPDRPGIIHGTIGEYVSLLAVAGPAEGVRTSGLAWALDGDLLDCGSTLGISNEFAAPVAEVNISGGRLIVVQPHAVPAAPIVAPRSPVSQSLLGPASHGG